MVREVFLEKKHPICDYSRSNEMPQANQIREIAPDVRTYS